MCASFAIYLFVITYTYIFYCILCVVRQVNQEINKAVRDYHIVACKSIDFLCFFFLFFFFHGCSEVARLPDVAMVSYCSGMEMVASAFGCTYLLHFVQTIFATIHGQFVVRVSCKVYGNVRKWKRFIEWENMLDEVMHRYHIILYESSPSQYRLLSNAITSWHKMQFWACIHHALRCIVMHQQMQRMWVKLNFALMHVSEPEPGGPGEPISSYMLFIVYEPHFSQFSCNIWRCAMRMNSQTIDNETYSIMLFTNLCLCARKTNRIKNWQSRSAFSLQ